MTKTAKIAVRIFAAVSILTSASAAQAACTGNLTVHNNTSSTLYVHNIYTQNKNGSWTYNASWPTGYKVDANKSSTKALNTTRNKDRSFKVKVNTSGGDMISDAHTCKEGWSVTKN